VIKLLRRRPRRALIAASAAVVLVAGVFAGLGIANAQGDTEHIGNGDFANGTDPWFAYPAAPQNVSGQGCTDVPAGLANVFDAGFGQNNLNLVQGGQYTLHFTASASVAANVRVVVQLSGAPFTAPLDQTVALTSTPQTMSFTFTWTETAANQISFQLGNNGAFRFCVDDVSLMGPAPSGDVEHAIGGTFDSGTGSWFSYPNGPLAENGQLCSDVPDGLANVFDSGVGFNGLNLVKGESYDVSFTASASKPVNVRVAVQLQGAPFTAPLDHTVALTTTPQTFTYNDLVWTETAADQIAFQLGNNGAFHFCVDNVSVFGPASSSIPAPNTEMVTNGTFDSGDAAPWVSYGGTQHVTDGRLCLDLGPHDTPGNSFDAAIQLNNLHLVQGLNYALKFTASASVPVIVRTVVGRGNPPFETFLGAPTTLNPANTPITFSGVDFTFPVTKTMDDGQIAFQVGGFTQPYTFCVDDISFLANVPAAIYTPDTGPRVRVNQVGYLTKAPKGATLVTDATSAVAWQLKDSAGHVVRSGQTVPRGVESSSNLNVHTIDFSSFTRRGTGFTLVADGATSRPFDIGDSIYSKLRSDALRVYYTNRSGIPILDSVQPGYARAAGHIGVAPNQGDTAVPCAGPKDANGDYTGPPLCPYKLDVTGGWYDAGDHGKYVVNGGISVSQLMGTWERNQLAEGTDRRALGDGTLAVPEHGNRVPDILDEARYELEFLLKMQVPAGQPLAGMAHHSVHDQKWTGLPLAPASDPQPRELVAPTTAATLNLAAAAAQGARVYDRFDKAFSRKLLTAARTAWAAALANPAILQPGGGVGGGAYDDSNVTDEFYWAATELYLTTGERAFRDYILNSPVNAADVFRADGFDWGYVSPLAKLELATIPNHLPGLNQLKAQVIAGADKYLATLNSSPWALDYAPANNNFAWGSNNLVLNNLVVIATAFDLTGKGKYRDGVIRGADYLFGRNALNQSYITGYGEVNSHNEHTRMYSHQLNLALPNPPVGTLAGGPNATASTTGDPVAAQKLVGCVPQFCYIDDIGSFSTNELAINWNSTLTWVASFLADQKGGDA
jgi:endoglucanase